MKIEKQCRALADALTEYVRNDLRAAIYRYEKDHVPEVEPSPPDSELNTDSQYNTVLIGGSLSGARADMECCIIGEGVDVVVGEGSVVIGCVFSRLELESITNNAVKELDERHRIEIGKNCILIGALIRDDCTIGDNSVIIGSAISRTTLGPGARMFLSSLLTNYGTVGASFTAVQTLFHTTRMEMGADAFMCSGKWGIISWGTAFKSLAGEIADRCTYIPYLIRHNYMLRDILEAGVDHYDQEKEKEAEEERTNARWSSARPSVHRRQYLALNKLAGKKFRLCDNITAFDFEGMTLEDAGVRPLVVIFRDLIREADADREHEVYDAHRWTLHEFYQSVPPRIHIGDKFTMWAPMLLCINRLDKDYPAYSWCSSSEGPKGFVNFTWKKFNGQEWDMFIGDDVTITMTGDWVTNRIPRSYDRAGRLVIKDGATLCMPQV